MVADKDVKPPRDAAAADSPCPRCDGVLKQFMYLDTCVEIEMCVRCSGLWLDHDEFREIYHVRDALRRIEHAPLDRDEIVTRLAELIAASEKEK